MRSILQGVTPFQGCDDVLAETRGVAPGYGILHRWCAEIHAPKVHPPVSPGHRPGFRTAPDIKALKGRNPSSANHFVDANKMIESAHPEARELEERIAENVVKILEPV